MVKLGSAYEDRVREVVAAIGTAQGVETLELETRYQVRGRTMLHEVDVWWRFRAGGLERSVWVSCKDWPSRGVDNEAMWAFVGKLNDIEPTPRGVFVVSNRLQSGAVAAAHANGIPAWELRPPTERDWQGRAHTVVIHLKMSTPERELEIQHVSPDVDEMTHVEDRLVRTSDVRVVLQDGQDIGALNEVMDEMMPVAQLGEETDWEETVRRFDPPARLVHPGDRAQPVSALLMRTRWHVAHRQITVGGLGKVALIINDALGDGMSVIDHQMRFISGRVLEQIIGPLARAEPDGNGAI